MTSFFYLLISPQLSVKLIFEFENTRNSFHYCLQNTSVFGLKLLIWTTLCLFQKVETLSLQKIYIVLLTR